MNKRRFCMDKAALVVLLVEAIKRCLV